MVWISRLENPDKVCLFICVMCSSLVVRNTYRVCDVCVSSVVKFACFSMYHCITRQ